MFGCTLNLIHLTSDWFGFITSHAVNDFISLILQVMKFCKIKYPQKFKFYIDSNSQHSRFAKLITRKDGSNLQFVKLSPHKI